MIIRTLIWDVDPVENGLLLSTFLRRKGLSRQNLVILKQEPESIRVNGRACHYDYRIKEGDAIRVLVPEKESSPGISPVKLPVDILYEDEDLIVCNKPSGMPVHPSAGNEDNSLANALVWYYREKDIPFVFRCSNRLDRDTSGVIVVAKHVVSAAILSEMGVRREIGREYLAIVRGMLKPPFGMIDVPIGRMPGSLLVRFPDPVHGEEARTWYQTITETERHTLVWLKLDTGRTHQIRVHLKSIGFPLIGDYLYNPDMEDIGRQALHAWRVSFRHPISGKRMDFTVPLPEDMARLLG